jgi:PPE-repeat protein
MSFLNVVPETVAAATGTLGSIGSGLSAATTGAAAPTTGIAAAAQDEVSIAIAGAFGNFGQEFQAVSAQAAAFHQQFVQLLNASAGSYAAAEAANAAQNIGYGNIGTGNIGFGNNGTNNVGIGNTGTGNIGIGNVNLINNVATYIGNIGVDNFGFRNIGALNTGFQNIGFGLTGAFLIGIGQFSITY